MCVFFVVVFLIIRKYRNCRKFYANSADPDQMLQFAASDLGLHCLPTILLLVSRH